MLAHHQVQPIIREGRLSSAGTAQIVMRLRETHPDAGCQLHYATPLHLLIATILTAQCSDKRVNLVTPELFKRYETAADYVAASRQELEQIIRPTGFYRQKARYIQGACLMLVNEHDGRVPADMECLLKLPGVSRKTANIILSEAFGLAEGIVVDTHVTRVAQRLGLTQQRHPKQIEQSLMQQLPASDWIDIAHLLNFHGQRFCHHRRPSCGRCPLAELCPTAD